MTTIAVAYALAALALVGFAAVAWAVLAGRGGES